MGEEEEEDDDVCKVVLLGETGVGKTCIISRFINNTFEEGLMSTNGAAYANKTATFPEYGDKTINFEIWDTAGQEKYRALNQIFYKDASICILVYDITREPTFKVLQEYWYQQVKENGPKNIILGLAGNKCDLFEKEQVNEEEARAFAKEINAIFEPTSAAKNEGIDDLFHHLGCKFIEPNYQVDDSEIKDKRKKSGKDKRGASQKKIKLGDNKSQGNDKQKKCC